MNRPKYTKPSSRSLGGLSGAEGACWTAGLAAYGTACTTGFETYACGPGSTATKPLEPLCWAGTGASNCLANGSSAQG
jgi:hypothetical protein